MTDMEDTAVADQVLRIREEAWRLEDKALTASVFGSRELAALDQAKARKLHETADRLAARHATLSMQPSVAENGRAKV